MDDRGLAHHALVTWRHGEGNPSINLVIVSTDASKDDPYGRQIERHSSVVHKSNQAANGMYWE